ncbi:MAG: DNA mismatch repair protein MutS, partial [Nitrospinales bacterium]
MMQQYQRIKREHPDTILFFRMGDFYEMFFEDAKIASPVLEIALTSRNKNKSNPIPMCGIPYHAANGYISKLIRSGKKVAICEQMEDPKATKGLVKREVVRIITPGTVLDDNLLDPKNHHFLASIFLDGQGFGLAALDLTTGLFRVTEFSGEDAEQLLMDEIEKLDPREILIPDSAGNRNGKWGGWLKDQSFAIQTQEDWTFSYSQAYRLLLEHFKTHSLEGFGCEDYKMAISAAGALVQYLHETQKSTLEHINTLSTFHIRNYMLLDPSTIKNMELVQASDGGRRGSLLDLLDLSQTPMGARRIKEWVLKPLVELKAIQERLELVAEFKNNLLLRRDL